MNEKLRKGCLFLVFILMIMVPIVLYGAYQYAPFLFGPEESFAYAGGFPLFPHARRIRIDEHGSISFISLESEETIIGFYRAELMKQGWVDNKTYQGKGVSFTLQSPGIGLIQFVDLDIDDPFIGPTSISISFRWIDYSSPQR